MTLEIIWSNNAINFLRKLDKKDSKRITRKINEIILNPNRYIFSLIDMEISKIRIGHYRIFVNYYKEKNQLVIISIKHRKNAYKN
jgi:mRNA-degrading endonuclease RelE of RelBE toxin-antitoxin system